ncbi:hypothetical protein [Borreliella bavariensis]|uniref:hypothetical protein n=1 Tax=Borreliella bavariensis TaxID=664662 RepID=UPI001C032887|nr:hypothetical protein [Borreliella bavariensis]
MNGKMFIICAVFALISSCKNYTSSKDLKNLEQNVEGKVKGFLEAKKEELVGGLKKLGSEAYSKVKEELMQADGQPQGQLQEQVAQGINENSKLKEEIEKKIEELKGKINKSDDKTPFGTYSEYEEEVKKIREELEKKLKDKKEDKEKLENKLKELEKSLKEKIEKRKKALEDAKKKFLEYKNQFGSTTGETYGQRAGNQGRVGAQAWSEASKLGLLNGSTSNNDGTNSDHFAKKVIDDAIKKIDEELEKLSDKKE